MINSKYLKSSRIYETKEERQIQTLLWIIYTLILLLILFIRPMFIKRVTFEDGYRMAENSDIASEYDCREVYYEGKAFEGCMEYLKAYPTFYEYKCNDDCSGHEAGYQWAEEYDIDDKEECSSKSQSFEEGCYVYVDEIKYWEMYE